MRQSERGNFNPPLPYKYVKSEFIPYDILVTGKGGNPPTKEDEEEVLVEKDYNFIKNYLEDLYGERIEQIEIKICRSCYDKYYNMMQRFIYCREQIRIKWKDIEEKEYKNLTEKYK